MTQCALILSSSRWHCLIHNDDVMFHSKFPQAKKQKNIIRAGLNGFTAEQLLYAVKYTFHCHFMLDVVNKQPVIKILILKLLRTIIENMVEIANMSQWKCALTMTAMVKLSAQIEIFQVSKGNKISLI